MPIPSLLLWRRVLDEARELTLWERIRRAVSLIVTVAIALTLALAVTRPALRSGARVSVARPDADRDRLVVVDADAHGQRRDRDGTARCRRPGGSQKEPTTRSPSRRPRMVSLRGPRQTRPSL